MLRDSAGNKLFRRVEIRVLFPDGIMAPSKTVQKAEPHKGFGGEAIDEMLMNTADQLDVKFPWWNFRLSELTPEHRTARYVFTCVGFKKDYKPAVQEPVSEPTPSVV